jgi:protein TonB
MLSKALLASLAAHVLFLLTAWYWGWERGRVIYVPQVFKVQLVAAAQIQATPLVQPVPRQEALETIPPTPDEKKKLKPKQKEVETEAQAQPQQSANMIGSSEGNAAQGALSGIRSDEIFEYPYFIRLMTDKISRNWRNPYIGDAETVMATIYFKIIQDGTITDERVEKSSGTSSFDRAALRAVVNSSPLPPLPPDFGGSQLTVHLDFEYRRN